MKIAFATGNKGKVNEAKEILKQFEIHIIQKDIELDEPRSESLEEIAIAKASQAEKILKMPVIAEDSGLIIKTLNGFPGTNSRWVFDKIGDDGILKLMNDTKEHSAVFKAVVAFKEPGKEPVIFTGTQVGTIANKRAGKGGFGFDPIFIPKGETQTWGQAPELKSKSSHRKVAIEKFAEWAKENL